MAEKTVGKAIKRTEDPRLIQGLAHYVDDVRLPDTLHAAFLRSIYAHARIKSIDTAAAQSCRAWWPSIREKTCRRLAWCRAARRFRT